MKPHKHPLCNDVLRAPIGDETCEDLHIQREPDRVWSYWKPSADELAAIVAGGSIALAVEGKTHPPLCILATTPDEPPKRAITPEESESISRAVNGRYLALVSITKRIVSGWVKSSIDSAERRNLVDQFLDLVTLNHTPGQIVRDCLQPDTEQPAVTQADVDSYRSDAEAWKAEAERLKSVIQNTNTIVTDGHRTMDAVGWRTECLSIEAELNTERELRVVAETNLTNLLHYVEDNPGHVPVSGHAVTIRDALVLRMRAIAGIREIVIRPEFNPNHSDA